MKKGVLLLCICLLLTACGGAQKKTLVVENISGNTTMDDIVKQYGSPDETTELSGFTHNTYNNVYVNKVAGTLIVQFDSTSKVTSIAWESSSSSIKVDKAFEDFTAYYNKVYGTPLAQDDASKTVAYMTSSGIMSIHAEDSGIGLVKAFVNLNP